jgi:hypothetical protein
MFVDKLQYKDYLFPTFAMLALSFGGLKGFQGFQGFEGLLNPSGPLSDWA